MSARHSLTPDALQLRRTLEPKLARFEFYIPGLDEMALDMLCQETALAEAIRLRVRRGVGQHRAHWEAALATTRTSARDLAAHFLLIHPKRVHLAELDAEGRDRELVAIFDPATPLRPISLTAIERRNLERWSQKGDAS